MERNAYLSDVGDTSGILRLLTLWGSDCFSSTAPRDALRTLWLAEAVEQPRCTGAVRPLDRGDWAARPSGV